MKENAKKEALPDYRCSPMMCFHSGVTMQKITPFLWFNNEAEEAVKFYSRIFKGTKVKKTTRYGQNMPLPEGTVMTIEFKMLGQQFTALNGGPIYKFNEA